MTITENNIKDNIGEYKLLVLVEQFIIPGDVCLMHQAEIMIQDYLNLSENVFVFGHRPKEYMELESDWNYLEVWHLDSQANRDRLILRIEL